MSRVEITGFTEDEEALVRGLHGRFLAGGFALADLDRIEKRAMPGYNGLVEAALPAGGSRLRSVLYVALPAPFTVAHELAHVSDIATRHAESVAHLGGAMSTPWHLAHRMTSEYYANRIACGFCTDDEIFPAFQNDRVGMLAAARDGDWAGVLINYALLLGIFHGLNRQDVEPLELLPDTDALPDSALNGMAAFHREADPFFQGYAPLSPALACPTLA